MAILEVEHLKKTYTTRLGSNRVEALKSWNTKPKFSRRNPESPSPLIRRDSFHLTAPVRRLACRVLEGKKYEEMSLRAEPIAKKLGITQILNKYPYEVSGGQKQRAVVARALITNPELVLAD